MSVDNRNEKAFGFYGFDIIDALILFFLGATLAFLQQMLQLDLGSKEKGFLIAFAAIGSLYFRELQFPKKPTHQDDPNRISLMGVFSALLACAGFATSIFGFSNLARAVTFAPELISEWQIESEVASRLKQAMLQEELKVFATAQLATKDDERLKTAEVLTGDQLKKLIRDDLEERTAQIQKDLRIEVRSELQAALTQQNDEKKALHYLWAQRLIPLKMRLC